MRSALDDLWLASRLHLDDNCGTCMKDEQSMPFLSYPAHTFQLKNGLSVIFLPVADTTLLALQVWVKTGSIYEGRWLGSGISHLAEHMLFKGTQHRTYAEIFREAQAQGAKLNAYTSFDRTVFTYDGGMHAFESGLELLSDMLFHSTFPLSAWEKEREVIRREMAMCEDDPEDRLEALLFKTAFQVHPYRYPIIGLRPLFDGLTLDDLKRYVAERYPVNNMTLVVAGGLSLEAVQTTVERVLGPCSARSVGPVVVPDEPHPLTERTERIYGDFHLVRGALAFKIPGLGHPDGAKLQVLATALGGNDSAILYQKLREEQGCVYEINASSWMADRCGLFMIEYTCEPAQRKAVEDALRTHLLEWIQTYLTASMLEQAYRQALVSELDARKTVAGRAHHAGWASVCLGAIDYAQHYLRQLRALTLEEVQAAANTYFNPTTRVTVSLEPQSAQPTSTVSTVSVANEHVYESHTLHGIPVVYQPCSLPKTMLMALFRGGALYESSEQRGMTQLLATLLTKDTQVRTAQEVAATVDALGGQWNAFVTPYVWGVSLEVLSSDVTVARHLLQEALTQPRLVESTFAREQQAQLAEWQSLQDNAFYRSMQGLRRQFFQTHPYAIGTIGTHETIACLTMDDCAQLRDQLLCASNMALSVVSSLPWTQLHDQLAPLCQAIANREGWVLMDDHYVYPKASRCVEAFDKQQAMVLKAYPMVGHQQADFYVGEYLTELFNGLASTFIDELREKRGLAYTVGALRLTGLQTGLFCLFAGTKTDKIDAVEAEMEKGIRRILDRTLTAQEFETSRTCLKMNRQLRLQSLAQRAFVAGRPLLFQPFVSHDRTYADGVDALTIDSFLERCQHYLQPNQSVTYILRPNECACNGYGANF